MTFKHLLGQEVCIIYAENNQAAPLTFIGNLISADKNFLTLQGDRGRVIISTSSVIKVKEREKGGKNG